MTPRFLAALRAVKRAVDPQRRVLIAAGFDGTLCPIEASPAEARLPQDVRLALLELVEDVPAATVAIITGRTVADARSRAALPVIYAGHHGLVVEGEGIDFVHDEARACEPLLLRICEQLPNELAAWPGAWLEEKGITATVHYRHVSPRQSDSLVRAVRRRMAEYGTRFGLRAGNKALEIHPRVQWSQWDVLRLIRERLDLTAAPCIWISAERIDLCSAPGDVVPIGVGPGSSRALPHRLYEQSEVAALLRYTATLARGEIRPATAVLTHRAVPASSLAD